MDKPTNGKTYFYVDQDGKVAEATWNNTNLDNQRLRENNAFSNRDEIHKHLSRSGGSRSGSAA